MDGRLGTLYRPCKAVLTVRLVDSSLYVTPKFCPSPVEYRRGGYSAPKSMGRHSQVPKMQSSSRDPTFTQTYGCTIKFFLNLPGETKSAASLQLQV